MPKFLVQNEIYRLLQRELPEYVYPDGPPSAFFSTAENDSVAKVLATIYANLERIYENQFPQTTEERIDDWEIKVFGAVSTLGLDLEGRRQRILAKLRRRRSLALWEILTIVASYLPEGKFVQVVEWGCGDGGSWILGVSKLGVNTALGWGSSAVLGEENFCSEIVPTGWVLGASKIGSETRLTGNHSWQEKSKAQKKAYTYEVRIFDYTLPWQDRMNLELELSAAEPARSAHIIRENLQLATYGLIVPVTDVDQFSGVNCITRDSGSSTGYSGREHF